MEVVRWSMYEICDALRAFEEEHGGPPVCERGLDYALYRVKPYVMGAPVFDLPYTCLENGVAYWDDERGRLANGDFQYLNEPVAISRRTPSISISEPWFAYGGNRDRIVMATKWGAHRNPEVRRVLCTGFNQFIWRGSQHADEPLGRMIDELDFRPYPERE